MYVKEKLFMNREELVKNGPITIVAFGDSVTHGALSGGEFNYETVYWNRLRQKLHYIRNYVPINIINAGIGGITAKESLERMDAQVLNHNPDLIIVCFGLNDIAKPLEDYIFSLEVIFNKRVASGSEVIFMTPNMLNTYVDENTAPEFLDLAARTAEHQNSGKMDLYMKSAVELAKDLNVRVCDCYSEWKKLSKTQDTTKLLCNHINHPKKEMHELFAQKLFEIITEGIDSINTNVSSEAMCRG
ncbi:MAG: GDSL family lipase [Clostridia bacterium]|nr:GDSL family lipase [Clostridia bacterium]